MTFYDIAYKKEIFFLRERDGDSQGNFDMNFGRTVKVFLGAVCVAGFVSYWVFGIYEEQPKLKPIDSVGELDRSADSKGAALERPDNETAHAESKVSTEQGENISLHEFAKNFQVQLVRPRDLSEFDLESYSNSAMTIDAAVDLYKAHHACRVFVNLKGSEFCESLREAALPSEFESLKHAAEAGNPEAQFDFSFAVPPGSELWSEDEIRKFRETRIDFLEESWASGSVQALNELAQAYYYGQGAEKDLSKAYFYAKTAQVVLDQVGEALPASYQNINRIMVDDLESVLLPYQREPIINAVAAQENGNCCLIFPRS